MKIDLTAFRKLVSNLDARQLAELRRLLKLKTMRSSDKPPSPAAACARAVFHKT
jgi:hypothetical protein